MNKSAKKLHLNRETLRQLTEIRLQQVVGRAPSHIWEFDCISNVSYCSGCYCPSNTDCHTCQEACRV